jgi:transcriptional regulator with XRE-family HTH domain
LTRYRLQELMDARGVSVHALARRAHIGRPTIRKIAAGLHEPPPATLERLATTLGVRPEELIEPEPTP